MGTYSDNDEFKIHSMNGSGSMDWTIRLHRGADGIDQVVTLSHAQMAALGADSGNAQAFASTLAGIVGANFSSAMQSGSPETFRAMILEIRSV